MSLHLFPGNSYQFHGVLDDHAKLMNELEEKYMGRSVRPQNPPKDSPGSTYWSSGKSGFGKRVHTMLKPEFEGFEETEEYVKVLGGLEGMALFFLGQRKAFGKHIAKVFDVSNVKLPTYSGLLTPYFVYQDIGSIVSLKNHGLSLDGELSKGVGGGTSNSLAIKCFEDSGISLS
jgi:hypothetical protein